MKVSELISKVREEKPTSFSNDKLISILNDIEREVAAQLRRGFQAYTWETSQNKELLAKPPYDRLYVSYIKAMIDYIHEEYDSYTNNQAQHVADFRDFTDWVVRTNEANDDVEVRPRLRNTF